MRIFLSSLVVTLLLFGASCNKRQKQTAQVRCDVPTVAVSVTYPGAGVATVEQALLLPIEEALRGIAGVTRIRSVASEGHAMIFAELDDRGDSPPTMHSLAATIERVTTLPEDSERPTIYLVDSVSETTYLVVHGAHSLAVLERIANTLRDELLRDPSVRRARLLGAPKREIEVKIDPARLAAFNISAEQVAATLRMESLDFPAGAANTQGLDDLNNIVLHKSIEGAVVYLRDIAAIRDGYAASGTRAWYAGSPAVVIAVSPHDKKREAFAAFLQKTMPMMGSNLPEGAQSLFLGAIEHCSPKGIRDDNPRAIRAQLRLQAGTPAEQSFQVYERAMATIGDSKAGVIAILGSDEGGQRAGTIDLLAFRKDRAEAAEEARRWHSGFSDLVGVDAIVESADRPQVTINLAHPEQATLQRAADDLQATLSKLEGTLHTDHGSNARRELQFSLNEHGRNLGIRQHDVARVLRTSLQGIEVSRLQRGRQEVRVTVRVGNHSDSDSADIEQVENLLIGASGTLVPLSDVVSIQLGVVPTTINRRDGRRITSVTVTLDATRMSEKQLSKLLRDDVLTVLREKYPGLNSDIAIRIRAFASP